MAKTKLILVFIISFLNISFVQASDWPQWRGPFFNGSADDQDIPESWTEEDYLWVSPMPGQSGATPAILGDRVYISSMVGTSGDFVAMCLDANTGEELWRKQIGNDSRKFAENRNNVVSSSPIADENGAYFIFGSGDLIYFNLEGNELWSKNIEEDYGNLAIKYGYSNSPLLYDGKLFVIIFRRESPYMPPAANGTLDSYIIALNPKTGEEIWKQIRPTNAYDEGRETYSTPMPFVRNGKVEIVNTGGDWVTAHDPNTGEELWRFEFQTSKVRFSRVISSLTVGDGLIFGSKFKHNGAYAIRPPEDDSSQASYAWEFDGPSPDVCTHLYYKDRVYILDGIQRKTVSCVEAQTGTIIWQGRIEGDGPWRASLTGAADKLYSINETGEIVVLAADKDEFEILFETKIDEGPIQASVAIANNRLYIRTAENLYCIGK